MTFQGTGISRYLIEAGRALTGTAVPDEQRYKDESFWNRQKQQLFPRLSGAYLRLAELSVPLALPGYDTIRGVFDRSRPQTMHAMGADVEHTRENLASLLHTSPENIYLTQNTTSALDRAVGHLIATGLLKRGDEVITTTDEYGSMLRVLDNYQTLSGLRIKIVKADGTLMDRVASAVTSSTRAIVASHVTHASCNVLPVRKIVQFGKNREIYTIIDAAQSIGQVPVDVAELDPDMLVGCGHKWLSGDLVSGILYISDRIPGVPYLYDSPWSIPPGKRERFDHDSFSSFEEMVLDSEGPGNAFALIHLGRALDYHAGVGWQQEYQRIKYLGDAAQDMLRQNPFVEVLAPEVPALGMIPFRLKGKNQREVQKTLDTRFRISITYKQRQDLLRVATSPFNTLRELEQLDGALRRIAAG